MQTDELLVIFISILGIGFTYWFFLMKKEKEMSVMDGEVDIKVDGGYQPDVIVIPKGRPTKINFTRRDPSSCLEEVVISDFKVRKYLPLNQTVSITLTPEKEGEFPFSCGMQMFHGKLKVTS